MMAGVQLIETMGWHPSRGIDHLALHLERLEKSAGLLGFAYDEQTIRSALVVSGQAALRLRLTLDVDGQIDVTSAPLPSNPSNWTVALHSARLRSSDPWLGVKTTNRGLYDQARNSLPRGTHEWIFLNEREELCEGTITNLFIVNNDGERLTPPLSSGVLPGVLRQSLINDGWSEAVLTTADLYGAREIYLGNALRGLIPAQLAPFA